MAKLRIPYIPGLPSLPIFVADDRKIFQKHGLDPELTNVFADTGGAVEEVAAGKADLTFPAFFFVLEKAIRSPGSLLVLQHQVDTNVAPTFCGLTVGHKSGINTVADLAGKKVGVFPAKVPAAGRHLFEAYAHSLAKNVDVVPIAPTSPDVPPGIAELAKGEIAALLTAQPIATFAHLQGAGKQISETPMAGSFPTAAPTSAAIATAKKDPAYTRAIAEALDEAIDIIRKEPDSMGGVYIKYQAMPPNTEQLGNHLVMKYWKSSEIGEQQLSISQVYADYLTKNGVITGSIDVDSLYLPRRVSAPARDSGVGVGFARPAPAQPPVRSSSDADSQRAKGLEMSKLIDSFEAFTKSAAEFSLVLPVFTLDQGAKVFNGLPTSDPTITATASFEAANKSLEEQLGTVSKSVFKIGNGVQQAAITIGFNLLKPSNYDPRTILQTSSNLVRFGLGLAAQTIPGGKVGNGGPPTGWGAVNRADAEIFKL